MAGILVQAGNDMPLHIQLACYETSQFPIAILKDDSGTFIKTVDLVDRGDGLYTAKESMPSKNVIATYKTFSDSGKTIVTDDSAGLDIFILDSVVSQRRDDKIVAIIDSGDTVEGIIDDSNLMALVEANEISVSVVSDGNLSGSIEEDVIEGKLACLGV